MHRGLKLASMTPVRSQAVATIHNHMARSYVYTTRDQRLHRPKYRHRYAKVLHKHLKRQNARMMKKQSHTYPVNNTLISQKLDAWFTPKRHREAMQVFYYVTERRGRMDDKNYVKLLKVVGVSSGRIDDATEIIEQYLKITPPFLRKTFVLNTYIRCCRGYPHRAYTFFQNLIQDGHIPDMNTVNYLLESYLTARPRTGNKNDVIAWNNEEERRESLDMPLQVKVEEKEPMDLMDLISLLNDFDPFVFTDANVQRTLEKLDVEIVDAYLGEHQLPSDISNEDLEAHKATTSSEVVN